jgi:hypothetical protein
MAAAKKEEKKPIMSCTSSGHITKLSNLLFRLSISMGQDYINLLVTNASNTN